MKRLAAFVLVMGCLFTATEAGAVWIYANGGYNSYYMADVNANIGTVNAHIAPLVMKKIHGGASYGFGLGVPLGKSMNVAFGYERLRALSDIGDSTVTMKYDFAANVFKATLFYTFPATSKFVMGLAGGFGVASSAGAIEVKRPGAVAGAGDVTDSGYLYLLAEGLVTGDYWLSPSVAVMASAGYRFANISQASVGGGGLAFSDGQQVGVNYSGVAVRLGMRFDLPSMKK